MGETTGITWCHHTFNFVEGCSKVSPGCAHCYAETRALRFGVVKWGDHGTRRVSAESGWAHPLKWDRDAAKAGERRRVFCASLADWLEDWTGPMIDHLGRTMYVAPGGAWTDRPASECDHPYRPLTYTDARGRLLLLIKATPNLDWLLLSKRPEGFDDRMHEVVRDTHDGGDVVASDWLDGEPPPNVVLMTTVENQEYAEVRVPQLLKIPAVRYGLSVEPQLGPVDLTQLRCGREFDSEGATYYNALAGRSWWGGAGEFGCHGPQIHWVITGGESGPGARPYDLAWARSLIGQADGTGCAVFVKQVGDNPVETVAGSHRGLPPCGHHGTETSFWPGDIRTQEFYIPIGVAAGA